jgi:GNAT superfamily N-acetyltransferase
MFAAFTKADLDRIVPLQPEGWADIVPYFRFYIEAPFCFPIKIVDHGELVAIGCALLTAHTGWLSHIITAPQRRGHGFGMAVTQRLIEIIEENHRSTQLLIATEMGQPLYEKLGFHVACDYTFFAPEPLPPAPPRDDVRPLAQRDLTDLAALDRVATGEDRRSMLELFWQRGWVVTDGEDRLRGFYLPDLAEGPVVAADADAGRILLRVRLGLSADRTVLPSANRVGLGYLADLGLRADKTLARMVRRGRDPLNPNLIFNRVGGHFG